MTKDGIIISQQTSCTSGWPLLWKRILQIKFPFCFVFHSSYDQLQQQHDIMARQQLAERQRQRKLNLKLSQLHILSFLIQPLPATTHSEENRSPITNGVLSFQVYSKSCFFNTKLSFSFLWFEHRFHGPPKIGSVDTTQRIVIKKRILLFPNRHFAMQ